MKYIVGNLLGVDMSCCFLTQIPKLNFLFIKMYKVIL
jgi:hypothetical protein